MTQHLLGGLNGFLQKSTKRVRPLLTSTKTAQMPLDLRSNDLQARITVSVGNDTYGITGIPSTVAGRGDREESRISSQHKGGLPRFGPQRCVKPYDPALVDVLVFLSSRTSYGGCVIQKRRIPLQYASGLLL